MELLAASPHLRFVNEPDIPDLVFKARLPTGLEEQLPPHLRKLLSVPAGSEAAFRSHLMNPRATRVRGPYNPLSPQYHLVTNRRVLKIIHATAIADWIVDQHLPLRPVYLARHPIATAVSMTRSNITLRALANLEHLGFCAQHLGSDLTALSWHVLRHGSDVERFVLEWCLDNLVPYRTWQRDPGRWSFLTYEELLLEPDRSLRALGDELDVRVTPRMLRLARVPSASTSIDRRKLLATSPALDLLGRWRMYVSHAAERRAFDVIDHFGIDLYEYGRTVAADRFLRFQETPRA
jgi:hypothetical protein